MPGSVTKVTVVHEDFQGKTATYTGLQGGGWTWILSNMKTLLETGVFVSSSSRTTLRSTVSVPHLHSPNKMSCVYQLIATTSTWTRRLQWLPIYSGVNGSTPVL
jgi:hypothetical protein